MDPWHHRVSSAVPALLRAAARGSAVLELIADGVHVSDETVRTVVDLVGAGSVAFVSDAMAAAGVGDGAYVLGGLDVVVDRGVARLDPRSRRHVAGLHRRRHEPRRRHRQPPGRVTGSPCRMPSGPARAPLPACSGWVTAARSRSGARADLVVVDEETRVHRVMRAGRWLGGS